MTSKSSVTSAMAPSKDDRERFVYVAKLAEQMKRFEDMAEAMKKVAKLGVELTEDERLLFSSSYKNMISAKRDSWRILSSKEQEVVSKRNHQNARAAIEEYRRKVELEISGICNDAMAVLDDHLIPSTPCREAFTFYHKMKGDYYRYLAEFKSGNERKEAVEESCNAYKTATSTAESDLSPAHPIRLGVALNFSVFHYEIMNSPERACDLARRAFDHALNEIDTLSQERYKDSATIMRLLRDNINVWTTELFDDGCRDL